MREKALSGMMAAVHWRDTDVEEREERISHLKKVITAAYLNPGGKIRVNEPVFVKIGAFTHT